MKKFLCLIALLGGCAAEAAPAASEGEGLDTQALVAPGAHPSCATILCRAGYVCEESCGSASCVPVTRPECTKDADCRLFSDYCGGCNCLTLGPKEPNPKCTTGQVQCLVDPCRNLEARCEHGSCVAGDASY